MASLAGESVPSPPRRLRSASRPSCTVLSGCVLTAQVVDAKFKTFGCGSAIASSSVATEWIIGKSVDDCLGIKNTDIAQHLKLPPVKLHCSMLAEDAIKAAIKDAQTKSEASAAATATA